MASLVNCWPLFQGVICQFSKASQRLLWFCVLWLLCLLLVFSLHTPSSFSSFLHLTLSCSGEGSGTLLQYSCLKNSMDGGAWWAAVHGVAKSQTWLSDFTFTFHYHALEKEMAPHSSVLAWRIPGTGEPGWLPSMGSHGVGHDWRDLAAAAAAALVFFPSLLFHMSHIPCHQMWEVHTLRLFFQLSFPWSLIMKPCLISQWISKIIYFFKKQQHYETWVSIWVPM